MPACTFLFMLLSTEEWVIKEVILNTILSSVMIGLLAFSGLLLILNFRLMNNYSKCVKISENENEHRNKFILQNLVLFLEGLNASV